MQSIRDIRRSKGIMQRSAAECLGVSRQTYRRYERNQDLLTIDQARAICDLLGCDINDVFSDAEDVN